MSFITDYAPRHTAWAALRQYAVDAEANPVLALQGLALATAVADTTTMRPQNLLELYLPDTRVLLADAEERPEHYAGLDVELRALRSGTALSDIKKNELFLTWQRPTALADATRERIRELTARRHKERVEDEEIVMEDGRTLAEHKSPGGFVFEDQPTAGDRIII